MCGGVDFLRLINKCIVSDQCVLNESRFADTNRAVFACAVDDSRFADTNSALFVCAHRTSDVSLSQKALCLRVKRTRHVFFKRTVPFCVCTAATSPLLTRNIPCVCAADTPRFAAARRAMFMFSHKKGARVERGCAMMLGAQ